MLFYLYKILKGILFPPGIFIVLLLINFFFIKSKLLRLINFFGAMILYILSISPTTDFLQLFMKVNNNPNFEKPDVIFILGAGLSDESISRIVKGYEVYKLYNVPIVISGYKAEAKMMKSKLSNFSIPDSMVILDSLARNTKENVRNFIKISNERNFKNIVVISSYYHLRRIGNEFRNSNLNIKLIASNPIDYTAKTFLDIIPSYNAFSRNMIYINEIIGIYVNSFKIFSYVK